MPKLLEKKKKKEDDFDSKSQKPKNPPVPRF